MAGLVAAARLRELGHEPRVVEKGTRAGGSMLLSSCVVWRHLEWECFRAECPGGDELLQRLIWERLDDSLRWLESLGAEPVWRDTENPLTTGRRYDPRALTRLLVAAAGDVELATPLLDGAEPPVLLATGGFPGRLAGDRGLLLRANPWSEGDGLDFAVARGAATTPGMDEFYGRVMPAPPARIREEDFVPLAQLYGRVARTNNELVLQPKILELRGGAGEPVSMEPMSVPEGELIVRLAALPAAYVRTLKVPLTEAEARRMEKAAAPTKSVRALELFARAQMAAARGGQEANESAVDLLSRAIEIDANFVVAQYTLGAVHQVLGNRWKAAAQFRAATQLDATYPEPYKALGDLFLAAPRRLFDQAVEAYNKKGLYYESVQAYRRAIDLDPQSVEARMGLGEVYEDKGLYKEAVEEYRKVIELDDKNTGALYNLALVYEKTDPKEAVVQWEKYIALASQLPSEKDWVDVARQHLRKLKGQIKE